ncbi:hypothetical protein COS91_00645 [Candidatus Desantisbacteria bacterium CG07_land_8_20_14_0_80_39_15]|uniref:Polymerase beta nucleotidyltransferase domain-containing protein n=2 Tax=unclassified Candidatus Desantisiibacteriota TaxID=3106372 RepID=A0A2H9PBP8_9BACT|nr:MAG: hypothetical protein COS91_00645 [Candidatus Desantisbacteria bacterium CG07_land_8_20_14_0_80_39_15]PIZ15252.1 MAG: hypothetical protein COY51_05755 [Candidatus Desantisbacteria bacterium CG_4_10_14_0_8_um_filter_39_17]
MYQTRRTNNQFSKRDEQDLKNFLPLLVKKYRPKKIILFGSRARGDANEKSDVDLVIVANLKVRFFKRIGMILDLYKGKRDLEPLVYTEVEFDKMIKEKRPFIEKVLKEGIILYENRYL